MISAGAQVLLHALASLRELLSPVDGGAKIDLRIATCVLLHPDAPLEDFVERHFAKLKKLCKHIAIYADETDTPLRTSEYYNCEKTVGRNPTRLCKMPGKQDALDVIVTTSMDVNVDALRHNYFALNPYLFKDLHDIFCTSERVSQ